MTIGESWEDGRVMVRQKKQETQIEHYSYAQFAALEIFDESVGAEALDQTIDNQRTTCREQTLERLRRLLDYYYKHPLA